MTKITDGDETRHLKGELAEAVWELEPEAFPSYLRALQYDHQHWVVETYFTELANATPLGTVYERALASTLVHEEALSALQKRAGDGDAEAASVLANILSYCGRLAVVPEQSDPRSSAPMSGDKHLPSIEDYPPERLGEFVQAVRDEHIIGDEYLAAWTTYWRPINPDGLLDALTAYRVAHGYPLEKQTAKVVVDLAVERLGRGAAWDWLIAYHEAVYGWRWHMYALGDVEWIWAIVLSRFRDRWLEFIAATSRPRWRAAGTPTWNIQRIVRFLQAAGEATQVNEVLDAAVRWGAGLAANMRLPEPALTPDQPTLPIPLRLLVDRLDCPSRMVQERAAWSLAGLLAAPDTHDATTRALLDWHAAEPLELRSCALLLILNLARTAQGMSAPDCVAVARAANIVPSIGADLLRREFGDEGTALASVLDYRIRHSGPPDEEFTRLEDFSSIVSGHLAPIFSDWATTLDNSGISFSRQWEWEAAGLATQQGLSLGLNAHFDHHYRGGADEPALAISDRLSVVLRSAYLRALHWSIDQAVLTVDRGEIHARRVGVMADPATWAVGPAERPGWWPTDPGDAEGVDMISGAVGRALTSRLEKKNPNENEVLLFAAGPVGNRSHFRAELMIRAFLQSAYGQGQPSKEELAAILRVSCRPMPPRLSLPGTYMAIEEYAELIPDWLVAPLAWRLEPDTQEWLRPELQVRGLHVPAAWLLPGAPTLTTGPSQVNITLGDQSVARYHYWNDELRERHYGWVGSRVGGELLVRREWLEPQLAAGATLCWIATLSIRQRGRYEEQFGKPQVVGTWVIGGSRMVWPKPWQPPSPASPVD